VPDVASAEEANPAPTGGTRSPWFHVACCPTNITRTLAALNAYVATTDDRGVQLHQLTGCTVRTGLPDGRPIGLQVTTDYPWSGRVTVRVEESGGGAWPLAVRVPAWAEGATLTVGEDRQPARPGYAVVERPWQPGDEVHLDLPVAPRWTRPDPRIDAIRGCVALERGPLVYCAESIDQTPEVALDAVQVNTSEPPAEQSVPSLGRDVVGVAARGATMAVAADVDWPYDTAAGGGADGTPMEVGLVPYYARANRGPAAMRVWLPEGRK
jgi:uncharacterized protein